jgi:nickel-dependent lactate racemase
MNAIQYQVLRYLPDRVTGEFVNLGIVGYDPAGRSLSAEFINCADRITGFFPGVHGNYLLEIIKQINQHLVELEDTRQTSSNMDKAISIESLTRTVLPKDDSSLIFSEVNATLGLTSRDVAKNLYKRIVRRYIID